MPSVWQLEPSLWFLNWARDCQTNTRKPRNKSALPSGNLGLCQSKVNFRYIRLPAADLHTHRRFRPWGPASRRSNINTVFPQTYSGLFLLKWFCFNKLFSPKVVLYPTYCCHFHVTETMDPREETLPEFQRLVTALILQADAEIRMEIE